MKILEVNAEKFQVFGDALKISNELKPLVYTVKFNKMEGFSLNLHTPLDVKEKLYGQYEQKVDKIVKSFKVFDRNLGVILSGAKGLGKSITARKICEKMNANGYPVILVDAYIPGIADFIASIKQECVVFFDEFEKTFKEPDDNDVPNPQEDLLSLFDGTSSGIKHLYIITCNKIGGLNDFILNRPGRFHYHIRWTYPTAEEIQEYLHDKLKPAYRSQIDDVIEFSQRASLNYDCLRAIAFELNMGGKFKEIINDMNILNTNSFSYVITAITANGKKLIYNGKLNMFSIRTEFISMYNSSGLYVGRLNFIPSTAKFSQDIRGYVLKEGTFGWRAEDEDDDGNDMEEGMKTLHSVVIKPDLKDAYAYTL